MLRIVRSTMKAPSYNPHTPALAPELGRAYAAVCNGASADADRKLRDIARALVQRLKDDGLPPERVIVAVKAAIVRYGDQRRPPSLAPDDDGERSSGDAYDRLFGWILEAYFGAC